MQSINFLTCTFSELRFDTYQWSDSTIFEALRKIRATWKTYADKMPEEEMVKLLRKESIIRAELRRRMRRKGILKEETHRLEEKLIGHNVRESPFKVK